MPLPTLILFALSSGLGAAVAGRVELRVSPRPALLTTSFGALTLFLGLVLVPISAYFYVFHGDWFLVYWLDAADIPSALALVGFLLQGLVGVAGFALGATLVRVQRDALVAGLAIASAGAGLGILVPVSDRLGRVGTYLQFHREFGLTDYGTGSLFQGTLAMGGLLVLGVGYLFYRLHASGLRRR